MGAHYRCPPERRIESEAVHVHFAEHLHCGSVSVSGGRGGRSLCQAPDPSPTSEQDQRSRRGQHDERNHDDEPAGRVDRGDSKLVPKKPRMTVAGSSVTETIVRILMMSLVRCATWET